MSPQDDKGNEVYKKKSREKITDKEDSSIQFPEINKNSTHNSLHAAHKKVKN